MVTASGDWAVTWAVIELWPSRDWAVARDHTEDAVIELWPSRDWAVTSPGLAGFFHLVEETGLNPGLNRPGRNRFLPPEVEETGKNWKKV